MMYNVFSPHPALRQHVRYFWTYDMATDRKQITIESFGDRFPRLIYQDIQNYAPIVPQGGSPLPATYLSGIDTRTSRYIVGGRYRHVGVSFYPHALHELFGIDADEVTNELPDLRDFYGTRLQYELDAAKSAAGRIELLTDFLLKRLPNRPRVNPLIYQCVFDLQDITDFTVEHVRKDHRISARHLQRIFRTTLGVSPKMYLKLSRFEKAVHYLCKSGTDVMDVAYGLRYADHSHFIREFKEFSGYTPGQFIATQAIGAESGSFLYA
jgi:AraC-like DNA-binding protein